MNFQDLEAFLAVADTGSFSRAAQRLHITQPAVTKRIQALEARLESQLFDRVGKRVHLTGAGRLLQPRAEGLLRGVRDAERELRDLGRAVAGELRLATSHHVGLHRLAPCLRSFTNRYPDVQLDISFEDSEDAYELVRRGDAELAVVTLNPAGDAELQCAPLWDDPLGFVVVAEHPLAAAGRLSLEELAAARPVLPGLGTYTGRIVLEAFANAGLHLRPNLATNYLETIAMLVSIGLGWSVLPLTMIKPPLVHLDVQAPTLRRTLGLVFDARRSASNAARAFREVVAGYADPAGTWAR